MQKAILDNGMNLAPEIERLVKFVKSRSQKLPLGKFTYEQLACYIGEKIKNKQLIVINDESGETIIGAVVFDPRKSNVAFTTFHIEQLWADNKIAMKCFLNILKTSFPTIKLLTAIRNKGNNCREVTFKLETLEKIYGR